MPAKPSNRPQRRVGLFGGSFDPVHNAHLALAHSALEALTLDEVRWLPAHQPWQKQRSMTPALHRLAMLELALAGEPRFVLDRIEIDRAGLTYTIDTVRALHAAHPGTEWFLLIGMDQYSGMHTWHAWQDLLGLVTLGVANRPGEMARADPQVQRLAHQAVPLAAMDISSTDIRGKVAQGRDISPLVPAAVARYIEINGLYRSPHRS